MSKNERKGTARLMPVSLIVVAIGVPSYFALDLRSDLDESKGRVVTLVTAAESHDDAIAAARGESDKAKEARDAAAALVIDLQAEVDEKDKALDGLRLKLEQSRATPRESCSGVHSELKACNELRIDWARRCRHGQGWHPKERLCVGLDERDER